MTGASAACSTFARRTVAKAGVTMALLGLLGGLAQKAGADQPRTTEAQAAKTISWTPKLSLKGITGNLRSSLVTIEKDLVSIYYKENKALTADVSSLKHLISAAKDNSYSKLESNATFLSKSDAGKDYLKIDGTAANAANAANAAQLGGVPAVQFGMVGSGAVSFGAGATAQQSCSPRGYFASTSWSARTRSGRSSATSRAARLSRTSITTRLDRSGSRPPRRRRTCRGERGSTSRSASARTASRLRC